MFASSSYHRNLAVIKMQCPFLDCHQENNTLVWRKETFMSFLLIANFWDREKIQGTTGCCHRDFDFDQDAIEKELDNAEIKYVKSYWKRNLLGCSPLFIILLLAYLFWPR